LADKPIVMLCHDGDLKDLKRQGLAAEEKYDGCFPYSAIIETKEYGKIKIGRVVQKHLSAHVKSYDFQKREVVWKPIINWVYKGSTADWMALKVPQTSRRKGITCTPNHEIYTPDGKKFADQLRKGDRVHIKSDLITEEQDQVILGTLLGDSSLFLDKRYLGSPRLVIPHSTKQKDYVEWEAQKLTNLGAVIETHRTSGFGSKMLYARTKTTPSLWRYYRLRYPKSQAHKIVDNLTHRGLAIWCMDDGTLCKSKRQRPRFRISTNRYPLETVQRMAKTLANNFGYNVTAWNGAKGPELFFNVDSTEQMMADLAPYFHPSLSYKLNLEPSQVGEKLDFQVKFGEMLIEAEILETVQRKDFDHYQRNDGTIAHYPMKKGMYDIEVADTHNYFLNDVLVGNTRVKIVKKNGVVSLINRHGIDYTHRLTEIVDAAKAIKGDFTIDTEAVFINPVTKEVEFTPCQALFGSK